MQHEVAFACYTEATKGSPMNYSLSLFPFPLSCYAPHYRISPYIPLELLRSPLQLTSLYSFLVVTIHTTAYFPIFPSSCYAPHYSVLPYIPLELLRSNTTAYFPIFPSGCCASQYSVVSYIPLELLRSPLQHISLYSHRVN
jgi:hypothetical protein